MGHKEGCAVSVKTHERLREAHPDLRTVPIIVAAWVEMAFRYIPDMKEGGRKTIRMLPERYAKGIFRRRALTPIADGRTRWEHPTTILTGLPTGFSAEHFRTAHGGACIQSNLAYISGGLRQSIESWRYGVRPKCSGDEGFQNQTNRIHGLETA